MKSNNILGIRLEDCRKKAGLTQQQLAAELCVQRQIVSYYENGSRKPDIEMLKTLADRFGVTTDYLLGVTDVQSTDVEKRAICRYTGLSEKAVDLLHGFCTEFYHPYNRIINTIIENDESAFLSEMGYDEIPYRMSLLHCILNYFNANQLESKDTIKISMSGKIKDDSQESRASWADITIAEVNAGEIAEQVLLNKIVEAVKSCKTEYCAEIRR